MSDLDNPIEYTLVFDGNGLEFEEGTITKASGRPRDISDFGFGKSFQRLRRLSAEERDELRALFENKEAAYQAYRKFINCREL